MTLSFLQEHISISASMLVRCNAGGRPGVVFEESVVKHCLWWSRERRLVTGMGVRSACLYDVFRSKPTGNVRFPTKAGVEPRPGGKATL